MCGRSCFWISIILLWGSSLSCESLPSSGTTPSIPSANATKKILPAKAVTFDVLLVQVPYQDRELVRQLWQDVDEQELDWETRQQLKDNGFRLGILGAVIPDSLSRLLSLKGRSLRTMLEEDIELDPDNSNSSTISKSVTLQEGRKSLIELREDVIPGIPVLTKENGQLRGKTYENARTILSVSIRNRTDGSVQFELTPMLRFGTSQMVSKYKHARLVRSQEQPSKTFDEMECSLALRPGQFLVMGAHEEKNTGLGHWFFTQGSDDFDQKLLVIRLLVTQHDEQFTRFPGFQELLKQDFITKKGAKP